LTTSTGELIVPLGLEDIHYPEVAGVAPCDHTGPWESALNAPGWEPECGYCNRSAHLVEIAGLLVH